jgi:hypothetical protein
MVGSGAPSSFVLATAASTTHQPNAMITQIRDIVVLLKKTPLRQLDISFNR